MNKNKTLDFLGIKT